MEANQIRMADVAYTDRKMLTVMFPDRASAESAYNDLLEKGYSKESINLAMSDETHDRHFYTSDDVHVTDSISTVIKDAAIGGTIGATVVGAAAAIAALILPGLGIVIAGPLAAALVGAGAGGLTGGIVGALEGAGIPEAHAKIYETGVEKGHIVIGFHPLSNEDAAFFEQKWREHMGITIPNADITNQGNKG